MNKEVKPEKTFSGKKFKSIGSLKNKKVIVLFVVLLVLVGAAIIFLVYPYVIGFAVGPKNETNLTSQTNISQSNLTNTSTLNNSQDSTIQQRLPANYDTDTGSTTGGDDSSGDTGSDDEECGNDILESGEDCDNGSSNTDDPDTNCYGQILYCDESCSEHIINCSTYCGDGIINSSQGEQCDASNLNEQTCQTLGYIFGNLSCSNCNFNTADCQNISIINSCQIINETNKIYALNSSIVNDTLTEPCIKILAENITLNCQGYSILSSSGVTGVYSNASLTTIKNCNISMGLNIGGYGIELFNSNNSYIFNNTLNSQYAGIFSSYSSNCIIENNTLNYNENKGIHLLMAYNNILQENEISEGSFYGIILAQSANNTIQSNVMLNNIWYGILIEASLSEEPDGSNKILNNIISSSRENLYAKTSNNIIKGNTLENSQLYNGLYIYEGSNNTIENNILNNNKMSGLGLNEATNNTIKNNTLNNNEEYGIEIYNSSSNVVENNTASGNLVNGLHVEESSENAIQNNIFCNNTEDVYCSENQLFETNHCNSGDVCGGSCEVCSIGGLGGAAGITGGAISVKKGVEEYLFVIVFIVIIVVLAILVNLKRMKK